MRRLTSGFGVIGLLIMLIDCQGSGAIALEARVGEALLKAQWNEAFEMLKRDEAKAKDPIARLIMGHACLALNRNNESLCLFLENSSEDDLKGWKKWTEDFARENDENAIAQYLKGDALARLNRLDLALEAFTKALEIQPTNSLALTARGVCYAAMGNWDEAVMDFEKVTQASPSYADAHASYGTMWIQKKTGAEGALESFNRALEISPDFSLALCGRGYAKFVLGLSAEAQKDIEEATKRIDCINPIVVENMGKIAEWITARENIELAKVTKENIGVTLETRLSQVAKGDMNALNPIARILGNNPQYGPMVNQRLNDIAVNNPTFGPVIGQKITAGHGWTGETGGGMAWLNFGKTISSGEVGAKGVSVGKFGPDWFNQQINKTNFDHQGWGLMKGGFKSPTIDPIGGVTTDLSATPLEKGDWPFIPYYGLLYPVKS